MIFYPSKSSIQYIYFQIHSCVILYFWLKKPHAFLCGIPSILFTLTKYLPMISSISWYWFGFCHFHFFKFIHVNRKKFICTYRSWSWGGCNSDCRSRSRSRFSNECWNGCWQHFEYIFKFSSTHIFIPVYISLSSDIPWFFRGEVW